MGRKERKALADRKRRTIACKIADKLRDYLGETNNTGESIKLVQAYVGRLILASPQDATLIESAANLFENDFIAILEKNGDLK